MAIRITTVTCAILLSAGLGLGKDAAAVTKDAAVETKNAAAVTKDANSNVKAVRKAAQLSEDKQVALQKHAVFSRNADAWRKAQEKERIKNEKSRLVRKSEIRKYRLSVKEKPQPTESNYGVKP